MVSYTKKTSLSGKALNEALTERGYNGKTINWGGAHGSADVLNTPGAVRRASNKRVALEWLRDNDISTLLVERKSSDYPLVGRPSYHADGSEFYVCYNDDDKADAIDNGCTHFQKYLLDAREFRIHIVNGKSIKLNEKVGKLHVDSNTHFGGRFIYPTKTPPGLRQVAVDSVAVLRLDFGCVDILYKDNEFFILEVNCAPSLSTCWAYLLPIYVEAFCASQHANVSNQSINSPGSSQLSAQLQNVYSYLNSPFNY